MVAPAREDLVTGFRGRVCAARRGAASPPMANKTGARTRAGYVLAATPTNKSQVVIADGPRPAPGHLRTLVIASR
jgi:hypothetical protein